MTRSKEAPTFPVRPSVTHIITLRFAIHFLGHPITHPRLLNTHGRCGAIEMREEAASVGGPCPDHRHHHGHPSSKTNLRKTG